MALTVNTARDRFVDQEIRALAVKANVHVYKGALVGFDAGGLAKPLAAGDVFAGLAYEEKNNVGGADSDLSVRVYTIGDFQMPLTAATKANNGVSVYASDDGTLTYTATANTLVGTQVDLLSAGTIMLRLKTFLT